MDDLESMGRALTFAAYLLRCELGPGGIVEKEPESVKAAWQSAIDLLEGAEEDPLIPLHFWRYPKSED